MNTFFTRLAFTALLLVSLPSSAYLISVTPSSSTATVGDVVSVAISISGLGAGTSPSLGAFDLDLGYDTGFLSYTGTVFGDPGLGDQLDLLGLGFGVGSVYLDTSNPNSINLFEVSFDPPSDLENFQADSFTLATLTFQAISTGTSPFSLTINALSDAIGGPLTNSAVPEPAIWSLYGIGMLAMGLLRRGRPYFCR